MQTQSCTTYACTRVPSWAVSSIEVDWLVQVVPRAYGGLPSMVSGSPTFTLVAGNLVASRESVFFHTSIHPTTLTRVALQNMPFFQATMRVTAMIRWQFRHAPYEGCRYPCPNIERAAAGLLMWPPA